MDELFMIEKFVGEVVGVVGLQFNYEKEHIEEADIVYEEFPEEPVPEKKEPAEGEEEEEQQEPAAEDEEEKKPEFRVRDYQWTVTDKQPRNLPQLFLKTKGINAEHDFKTAEQYSVTQHEAVSKCLDDFLGRVCDRSDNSEKYIYTQVIFTE